jgi:3-isopropylmalate/(R)-2-methylmalate dehydratase small subunit
MPQPFRQITAIAAPLLRDNVDTDTIIPSREIQRVGKSGLAAGLFAGWRYQDALARQPDPGFILNQAPYSAAHILLTGENFGCGSSREHAVWALVEYGIRVVLAPSFAPIFFDNCINNGLLAACVPAGTLQALARIIQADPLSHPLTVDLERCSVSAVATPAMDFEIEADARARLLGGLNPIELTLRGCAAIDAFQARDRGLRPWVYLGARR